MTKEFLNELGIVDEAIIEKIISENESDINSTKLCCDTLRRQLDEANRRIDEFGSLDYDGIRRLAEDYKEKYRESVKAAEKMMLENAADSALTAAKARNITAVKALIDFSLLELSDGKVIGLDEQIDKIKHENPFLFEPDENFPKPVFSGNSGSPGTSVTYASARSIMGLPADF